MQRLLADWLSSQKSPHTRRMYAQAAAMFLEFAHASKANVVHPEDITHDLCLKFMRYLLKRYGERRETGEYISVSATATTRFSAISSMLNFAVMDGRITRNPAAGILKRYRSAGTPTQPVPLKQAQRFAVTGVNLSWGRHPSSPQALNREVFRVAAIVLLSTACRRGEVCSIRVRHYTAGRLTLLVKGGRTNTVTLPPAAAMAIEDHIRRYGLKPDDQLAWVPGARPLTTDSLGWMLRRVSRAAGMHLSAHQFRATVATALHCAGVPLVDLQKFMGHANPQTTARYIQLADEKRRAPALKAQLVPGPLTH